MSESVDLEARWARWRPPHRVILDRLSLLLVVWGVWVLALAPWETSPAFGVMEVVADERVTGLTRALLGVLAAVSVRGRPRARVLGATVLSGAWAYVAVTMALAVWRTTGVLVYSALSLWCVLAVWESVGEALAQRRGGEDA